LAQGKRVSTMEITQVNDEKLKGDISILDGHKYHINLTNY